MTGRKLIVHGLQVSDELMALLDGEAFAAMLPAYSKDEVGTALKVAEVLFGYGCKEFCCVGVYAAELEDELDFGLECRGMTNVVTTAFADEFDAAEYFLFAAGGGRDKFLIALVAGHEAISSQLSQLGAGAYDGTAG